MYLWLTLILPSVSVQVIAEVHYTITAGSSHTARSAAQSLDSPKTTILKVLHSVLQMFLYLFQHVQMM